MLIFKNVKGIDDLSERNGFVFFILMKGVSMDHEYHGRRIIVGRLNVIVRCVREFCQGRHDEG